MPKWRLLVPCDCYLVLANTQYMWFAFSETCLN